MKDKGVRAIPRALQVESHREGILGAGPRAWDAQRREETRDGVPRIRSQQVGPLLAIWFRH
jgi:hypothetical protein